MNGTERRRMELYHPEKCISTAEKERRKEIIQFIVLVCNGVCMTFMIIFAIIISFFSVMYMGITGFFIAFFGSILDIILGMLLAYYLGEKMRKLYLEKLIYE